MSAVHFKLLTKIVNKLAICVITSPLCGLFCLFLFFNISAAGYKSGTKINNDVLHPHFMIKLVRKKTLGNTQLRKLSISLHVSCDFAVLNAFVHLQHFLQE